MNNTNLFMQLIREDSQGEHTEFYDSKLGKFSALNDIDKINFDAQTLKKIQVDTFKKLAKTDIRLAAANDFINNTILKYNQNDTEDFCANIVFKRIAELLNSPFKTGSSAIREETDKVIQLEQALNQINVNLKIPEKIIDVLGTASNISLEGYKQEKANFFEEIVTAFIVGNKFGKAVTTGSWTSYESGKQLVTDVYAFLQGNTAKIKGKYVAYDKEKNKITQGKSKRNTMATVVEDEELEQFISIMNTLTGKASISIGIQDELEKCLNTLSSLRISVKSGVKQSILNDNEINTIQLSVLKPGNKLKLLENLYNKTNGKIFIPEAKSSTLNGYANYLLSKNIAKTTLRKDNDIYFTENGFETAENWMRRRGAYLKFKKNIQMNANLLGDKREFNFYYSSKN